MTEIERDMSVLPMIAIIDSETATCKGMQKNITSNDRPFTKSQMSLNVLEGIKTGILSAYAPKKAK